MGRPSKDEVFIAMAVLTSKRSTCLRRAVGAVAVNARGHMLSSGYNGVAAGQPHCNQGYQNIKYLIPGATQSQAIDAALENSMKNLLSDFPHACDGAALPSGEGLDKCEAVHAEQNMLLQCRDVYAIDTVYCTASPCVTCAKLLLNTGCQRVVFFEEYTHPAAKELWLRAGRIWEKFSGEELWHG